MHFRVYKHRMGRHYVQWERVDKVYLGPRKRAYEALKRPADRLLDEVGYLDFLGASYPDLYESLEWVRFHSFVRRDFPGVHMRLAVSSVRESPSARDRLFSNREIITRKTGWYPLVQGKRAEVHDLPYTRTMRRMQSFLAPPRPQTIGSIAGVNALCSSAESGNSFRVMGSRGSLILDAGFHGTGCCPDAVGVVLTHMHQDHSGGIFHMAQGCRKPVFVSETTMSALWSTMPSASADERENLASIVRICNGGEVFRFDDGSTLEFFRVFHCPGAIGVQIQDSSGHRLIYFGDLCIRNGFGDYSADSLSRVLDGEATGRTVILDATMAGRETEEIDPEDTPEAVLADIAAIRDGVLRRNVFFLSNQIETLLYAYLQSFYLTRASERPIRLLVDDGLYQLLRSMLKPLLTRHVASLDPVVKKVVGHALTSNFVETHRLYPLREEVLAEISSDEPLVILSRPYGLGEVGDLSQRLRRSMVYLCGTMALREDIPDFLVQARPRGILRVSSPDWSFHSSEADLVAFIRQLTQNGVRVLLFHSYPKTLRRLIRDRDLDREMVSVIE